MTPRRWRRSALALVVVGTALFASASPAAADPPGPTNFRSTVDEVVPDVDGVEVSIVGGDGFLLLEVERGHTAEVAGYSGEPYLRFADDGTVEENRASPAYRANQSRDAPAADDADPDAEPAWTVVATDGRWAWHDHRVHYMGGDLPAGHAARTTGGLRWTIPLVVDGEGVEVRGHYRLLSAPSPLPWLALAAVVVALVVALGRLLAPVTAAGVAVLASGVFAVAVGWAQRGADPPGAATSSLVVILPAVAVIAGVIAVMQRGRVLCAVAALAGAAAGGGWALVRISHLWTALLPTSLSPALDRAAIAVASGAAVGAAILVVRSGALATIREDPSPSGAAAPD